MLHQSNDGAVFNDVTLTDIVQITSGETCALALTANGIVYGRGGNENGELAQGDTYPVPNWTKIANFHCIVMKIALKRDHCLFLTMDGQVFSSGNNEQGQLVCALEY